MPAASTGIRPVLGAPGPSRHLTGLMDVVSLGADAPHSTYAKPDSAFLPMLTSPLPTNQLSMYASHVSPAAAPFPCSPSHRHLHLHVPPCSHLSQAHHLPVVSGHTWSASPWPGTCAVTCPHLFMGSHIIRMDRVRSSCLTRASNYCQLRSQSGQRLLPCMPDTALCLAVLVSSQWSHKTLQSVNL